MGRGVPVIFSIKDWSRIDQSGRLVLLSGRNRLANLMSIYRNIVAVMVAILIASPLCCCSLPAAARENAPEPTCCSHKNATEPGCPGGQSCPDCRAKDPRLSEAGKTELGKVVLPELAPLSLLAEVSGFTGNVFAPSLWLDLPDPGPPGWRLVLHQTFLI
jgi:hypothetical protein